MEEINEDEFVKVKKWKRDDNKDIDLEKEVVMEVEIKVVWERVIVFLEVWMK